MKRLFVVVVAVLLIVGTFGLLHKSAKAQTGQSVLSRVGGVYNSTAYKNWGASIVTGNTATGSQTDVFCPYFVALPDGRVFQPFASAGGVFTPITVDIGSNSEVVTPTATSLVAAPSGAPGAQPCASVTASFSNTHGAAGGGGALNVTTGDQGIQEAITDAALNNGGLVFWFIDPGIVTMNTGGANTNLGSVKIPTRSVVMHASANVTTTIATCAGGWSLGFSSGTEFGNANTTLTAGTTTDSSTLVLPVVMTAAATVPIAHCTTSNASAGAIHATLSGYKVAAPNQ